MAIEIEPHASALIDAIKNPKDLTTETLHSAIKNAQDALVKWQGEGALPEQEATEKEAKKPVKRAKRTRPTLKIGLEGVDSVVRVAARSPGTETAEPLAPQAPSAPPALPAGPPTLPTAPPAPVFAPISRPARRFAIPKNLAIDMVDEIAVTDAGGRGQRTRKP